MAAVKDVDPFDRSTLKIILSYLAIGVKCINKNECLHITAKGFPAAALVGAICVINKHDVRSQYAEVRGADVGQP